MHLYKIVNGFLHENCYLIGDSECYIVDPGSNANAIIKKIEENFTGVKAILLTHGHFDHIGAVDELVDKYNCPVYMSDKDIIFTDGSLINDKKLEGCLIELNTKTIDAFMIKDSNIIVYETPGHSKGSVCYLFKKENIMFTGDTLFKNCVGRVDLATGSEKDMYNSLRLLKELNDNIKIYPGHEEESSLGEEKRYNPYLQNI